MNIAIVSPIALEQNNIAGGVAAVTQFLTDALTRLGNRVTVVSPGKTFGHKERRGDFDIVWVGHTLLPGFLTYGTQQRRQINRVLAELQPDIVHFQGAFGWSIDCPLPYVVTIHGIAERDAAFSGNFLKRTVASKVIRMTENIGRRKAAHVISISPYATDMLENQLSGNVADICNPIDSTIFQYPAVGSLQRDSLVCVGVVGERKNTLGVIEAFAKFRVFSPEVTLKICGHATSEEYLQACKKRVADLALDDAVTFTGNLDRASLYKEISAARALIMMSKQETAPMAIAEAMALGIPCLAPEKFGIPYMIEDGVDGWFISDTTSEDRWQRIATSLAGENWLMLSANAKVSANQYHPDQVARKTLEVYAQAIAEH